jgi:YHS domain-containing protein
MAPSLRLEIKWIIVTAVLFVVVIACTRSSAVDPVNTTSAGLAIKGYDTVAYSLEKGPVKGKKEFEYTWMGARWLFASTEHLDMFKSDPEKYAPKYGGYCAYAVSQGTTADFDPKAWSVVDGKLYLNLNEDVQNLWMSDMTAYIKKADENWPGVLKK